MNPWRMQEGWKRLRDKGKWRNSGEHEMSHQKSLQRGQVVAMNFTLMKGKAEELLGWERADVVEAVTQSEEHVFHALRLKPKIHTMGKHTHSLEFNEHEWKTLLFSKKEL